MNGKKPVKNPVVRVMNRNGGSVIPGNPGNRGGRKGRSGRKPNEWKAFCGELLADSGVREAIKKAAKDPETRGYANLLKMLAAYAVGVPAQKVEVTGEEGGPVKFTLALGEAHVDPA